MSELKSFIVLYDGKFIRAYEEKEADKVIAEKDEAIKEMEERIADGDKDFEMANNQNERLLKIVRHQKYKRCLAMAKWCDERIARIEKDYAFWRHGKDYAQNFYKKWHKRWLSIAEKFKPNN